VSIILKNHRAVAYILLSLPVAEEHQKYKCLHEMIKNKTYNVNIAFITIEERQCPSD
jgi:hypothetical protein